MLGSGLRNSQFVNFKNNLASKMIKGETVSLDPASTAEQTLGKVSTSTSGNRLFMGLTSRDIDSKRNGRAQCYGFFKDAVVAIRSRAATNGAWALAASKAVGFPLAPQREGLIPNSAAGAQTVAYLLETLAAVAAAASGINAGNLLSTTLAKVFIRAL